MTASNKQSRLSTLIAAAQPFLLSTVDGQNPWDFEKLPLDEYACQNHPFKDGRIVLDNDHPSTIAEKFFKIEYEEDGRILHHVVSLNTWFLYENGQYREISEKDLENQIWRVCQSYQIYRNKKIIRLKLTISLVRSIVAALASLSKIDVPSNIIPPAWLKKENQTNPDQILPMANGLLDLSKDTPILLPQSPGFLTTFYLPYTFEKNVTVPKFENFLIEITCGNHELVELLIQWMGYLLTRDQREQRFFLGYGSGSNGKGVYSHICTALVGSLNVSNVPLSRFSNPFAIGATFGKRLNITNEASREIELHAESILKEYTGGDRISFERKYRDPIDDFPTAKMMILTNELPRFRDRSEGVWRRVILCPFNAVIPKEKQNKRLKEQLEAELPGILNLAILGLKSLRESGGFIEPAVCRAALDDYRREADPIRAFLLDNYVPSSELDKVYREKIYRELCIYCEENGHKKPSVVTLGKEIKHLFPNVDANGRDSVPDEKGKRQRYYSGLQKKDEPDWSEYGDDDLIPE
ncbi:MAG: hypothetical protein JXA82_08715 [Sedimentisphaerales bacterium]|nr:hypothetical protein [Sedimentisphaerales bacterium]